MSHPVELLLHELSRLDGELISIRRDLHAHPELARTEQRTTQVVADRLVAAGLTPRLLPGTGLTCDIGPSVVQTGRRIIALRADIDALPVQETTGLPFASVTPNISHACGHDVHAAVVLGAGLALAAVAERGLLATGVRLVFQPAEEVMPGGALDVINAGAVDGVAEIFALHCDPRVEAGSIGTRVGPITSASDSVTVTVTGEGGHTSRPHLTGDVVYVLGQIITQVPAVLGRRLDPRSGVNLTWGQVQAGSAQNAIPSTGTVRGTLRCLDVHAWERAAEVFSEAVAAVASPYGVEVQVKHVRGVPPVNNSARQTLLLERAGRELLGDDRVVATEQSLGGEDFAWYLTKVPGALARLGIRGTAVGTADLHQGDLMIDESAIGVGARVLAGAAYFAGIAPAIDPVTATIV